MTPTATGRHCAACAKTVVDFTLKTDTEILAYLTKAAGTQICGRFVAEQLNRPLLPAFASAPMMRWQAWLAAAVALWSLRETFGAPAQAQTPTEWRARYWGGPVPAAPPAEAQEVAAAELGVPLPMATSSAGAGPSTVGGRLVVRGVVRDAATNQPLPGVVVFMAGLSSNVSTDREGNFYLALAARQPNHSRPELAFQMPGYQHQQCVVPTAGNRLEVYLSADQRATGVEVVAQAANIQKTIMLGGAISAVVVYDRRHPWPWHPRLFYHWSKYWLTRPFHRKQK